MSNDAPFGLERTPTREQLLGADDAAVDAASLSPGVADAAVECAIRYEEAIKELAAAR